MKYIRTKDNRLFRVIKDLTYENTYHLETNTQTLTIMTEEKYLSTMGKIADTVEELCDEFVLKRDKVMETEKLNEIHINTETLFDLRLAISVCLIHNVKYQIFGAIWTDKGLIYVAKMNEKGELELL